MPPEKLPHPRLRKTGQRVQERTRGERWMQMRSLYLQQYPLCDHCDRAGRVRLAQEVDHIVPLSQGGTDAFENLQGLCKACHAEKTAEEHPARRDKPVIGLDGWPQEAPQRHDPDAD